MCKSFFTIALICSLSPAVLAQTADHDVRAVVERLFDGMREGDSTAVRAVLHPEARLSSTTVRDDKPQFQSVPVNKFLEAVGTPHDDVWDEQIWNLVVNVDDRLATAWMDYAFFIGDRFSHCGVNAIQLFQGEDGWKIIQITDTRRTEGCELRGDR